MPLDHELAAHPRLHFAHLPTPLERLARLSDALRADIWIKRDDQTGLAGGGNKARKLEFLMGAALAQGADTIVTAGALQSNHARQTAAAAARLGLHAVLVLADAVPDRSATYHRGGNLALDRLLGAEIRQVPPGADEGAVLATTVAELIAAGRRAYTIPVGGSNLTGALGYAAAGLEIEHQCHTANMTPACIITGSGSAGTQAGLLLGTAAPVLGISVSADAAELRRRVGAILHEAAQIPALATAARRPILVNDRFVGSGYGQPTPAMLEALALLARLEGIILDPVYSGKAMAGLIQLARDGELSGTTIFLHTGGMPALFVYDDVL